MVEKIFVVDAFILSIVIILFLIMLYVTYKVFKITIFKDKVLLLMLFFLDITLICKHSQS